MTDTAPIRSFVAIDLDPLVLDALQRLQAELARVRADVRWVRPTGMHVTLKFLGPVEPGRLEQARAALQRVEQLKEPVGAIGLQIQEIPAPRVV